VRCFYEHAPFPNIRHAAARLVRARAERSEFARLIDRANSPAMRASWNRVWYRAGELIPGARAAGVIGADSRAHRRTGRGGCATLQDRSGTVHRPTCTVPVLGLSFDVVYSSGVLHHTPDPRAAFARVVQLARPGGMIVLGLYNSFARIPFRLRRLVARLSGYQFIPFDPVLCDRENEPARRTAWLRDQYQHPEEHRHTLAEVQGWFAENGVDYVRAYPSAMLSQETEEGCSRALQTTGVLRAG